MWGGKRIRTWVVGAEVTVALGTLSFLYHYLDDRANGIFGTARLRAMTEFTGAAAAAVVFVAVYWMVRRWPARRAEWRKPLALYAVALPVLGAANTTLLLVSRKILAPMVGLPGYSYGDLWYRYPMEFSYQIVIYAVMIGGLMLVDAYRENERRERDLARAELQNLRLQLQPHFLFNALNTISAVMYEDVGRAEGMLQELSGLLRRSLAAASGGAQEVPLAEELDAARQYLAIQQARFEDRLKVDFEVEAGTEQAMVPHFLLQPLIENAVRHGGGTITVRAARERAGLALEVRDTGRSEAVAAAAVGGSGHGIGLPNTAERLRRLYGEAQRFEFGPLPGGGFRAAIEVPFKA